jgi:2,3-bisphosphoglycerate-dependent phosphoglycerate mutase
MEVNMTKIYLIRHAEAEGNLYRRVQGHYNGDITTRGYKQIDLLAERFRDIEIDALYASDLSRTQKTAGAILKYHDLPLNITPRLKEVGMGVWEDQPWGNVAFDDPEQMRYFSNDPEKWEVEGAENFKDLKIRITNILLELAEKHEGQTIACVSHGMAIRTFISGVKGVPSEQICEILHGDNTCVTLLDVENGKIEIEYYNDNDHLPNTISTFAAQKWWKEKDVVDYSNLRIVPMDLKTESEKYLSCYRDGWMASHGTMYGYSDEPYLQGALRAAKKNPRSLMKAMSGDKFIGIIELDTERMAEQGVGWISFCYLAEDYRGQNLGVQLLGHAVSVYRSLGRHSLRLHVAETNKSGIAFYEKFDFKSIGTAKGNLCSLWLMEKEL